MQYQEPIMLSLGMRMRRAREKAGMTQEMLAERVGVSRTAVARWESGDIEPTITHLAQSALVLHVSADELLGIVWDEAPRRAETLSRRLFLLAEEMKEVASHLDQLK